MQKDLMLILRLIAIVLTSHLIANSQQSQDSLERKQQLAYYADESRIDEFVLSLSAKYHPENFVIQNVTVVSVTEGRAVPNQNVVVKDGRVAAIGPSVSIEKGQRVRVINGTGAYLIPGLTDSHIHQFGSSSQHLLNLMEGVTSVRDMDGFPWTLRMR